MNILGDGTKDDSKKSGDGEEGEDGEEKQDGSKKTNESGVPKKEKKKRLGNAANTLESNEDNLVLKTFDLEFEVDPLFKKTSASLDEGGTRGMLLNNLSVQHSCSLLFDSGEKSTLSFDPPPKSKNKVNLMAIETDISDLNSKDLLVHHFTSNAHIFFFHRETSRNSSRS
jgi:hypothetical protein